ncbi:hypothetical protein PAXINDRAFT_173487 [Paxillus involutus ATCC 200175]|uniref:Uncharacterized protein n=1 Tax=Paxillus involutus ATCC 200175 TaxID=664439 RepID=A0A0C9SWZ1_PAXIN|nr:hypothetical protein PAXINDRAFT_173487 [Paxillus involutus ATCC 200175]
MTADTSKAKFSRAFSPQSDYIVQVTCMHGQRTGSYCSSILPNLTVDRGLWWLVWPATFAADVRSERPFRGHICEIKAIDSDPEPCPIPATHSKAIVSSPPLNNRILGDRGKKADFLVHRLVALRPGPARANRRRL